MNIKTQPTGMPSKKKVKYIPAEFIHSYGVECLWSNPISCLICQILRLGKGSIHEVRTQIFWRYPFTNTLAYALAQTSPPSPLSLRTYVEFSITFPATFGANDKIVIRL